MPFHQQPAVRGTAERVARAVTEFAEADRDIPLMRHAVTPAYEDVSCRM